MTHSFTQRLRELEAEHGFHVLYACEAGSRAWGFESDDSDYDVRFVYAYPTDWYLSLSERKDSLDLPIEGDLDLSGWEFRKALRLFGRSNGALLEWLHSPIVYQEHGDLVPLWRALVPDVLDGKALAGHYLGMAKKAWFGSLQSDEVSLKRYLYALRSLLAARWVLHRRLAAPVRFDRLLAFSELDEAVTRRVTNLMDAKRSVGEAATLAPDPLLHAFLESQLSVLGRVQAEMQCRVPNDRLLDVFFQRSLSMFERESGGVLATA